MVLFGSVWKVEIMAFQTVPSNVRLSTPHFSTNSPNVSKVNWMLTMPKKRVSFRFWSWFHCEHLYWNILKHTETSWDIVKHRETMFWFCPLPCDPLPRPSKASKLMEVQFEGETGFGVAVTQSFYAPRVAKYERAPCCLMMRDFDGFSWWKANKHVLFIIFPWLSTLTTDLRGRHGAFQVEVAQNLQDRSVNSSIPMWVPCRWFCWSLA